MGKFVDLTGRKFGLLTVVKRVEDHIQPNGKHRIQYLCKCDCGNEKILRGENLKSGNTKSCGCLHSEIISRQMKKYNTYNLSGEYGVGYTPKGEEFYFDLEDYDKIKNYCLSINQDGYVYTNIQNGEKWKILLMHRFIMDVNNKSRSIIPDHIHGKETRNDNRKINLRLVTHSQNLMNSSKSKSNKSNVTGVYYDRHIKQWIANICIDRKTYKKAFPTKDKAIKQRKLWEEEYFGEYSYDISQNMEV